MPNKNSTPSRTPTVAIEAGLIRNATHAMISHAIPVSRNIHQGPASCHSACAGAACAFLQRIRINAHTRLPFASAVRILRAAGVRPRSVPSPGGLAIFATIFSLRRPPDNA